MSKIQVLTIAGSDSGGGAGIQADIKTFQERDVFGTSVITAVTAQNTLGVHGIYKVPLNGVRAQMDAVFSDFDIAAMKTGMLVDETYISLIAEELSTHSEIHLVVDPVMVAKGGAHLMETQALKAMRDELAPLATVLTPNIPEAEELTGMQIKSEEDMKKAAAILQEKGSRNVLIKGGHMADKDCARDYLLMENQTERWYETPRIETKNTHGTGCTFSACIAAELAKGKSVEKAVETGKAYIQAAISQPIHVGNGHGPTNHWAYRESKQ
ncbi:bifunctional hydroxymethylpyrimidine kinase/phosphomethylpyrimidine kinase [Alkalibacterium kapii]|uniref:Hydroxymethylpyrimidine/phosphomethylpyrimidine kinase n=1 Tax=Alkalibacterium kapii TaxID=426704 RepID=A0A511B034_9LACT|nr:bifunctional hydroxymethylpyrimidine kinase/phosphomethylpyrimidine kinase [Alkalibacterium kapii]GEK91187.1 hydroxymethylpyrimidine/phosphomethylpyrimidine kinase [Alkalibacterium kapii]